MVYGLALCAGIGGIELGLRRILPAYRCVCYVEQDAFCACTLVARMEDQALDRAPIWDDVGTFDGVPWRGVVDLVTSGFPCRPWSALGRRGGKSDSRWLWPHIIRIIRQVGPRCILLENVPGLVRGGLGQVLGELAESGFDAEWGVFRASSLGLPHVRERLFALAYADREYCTALLGEIRRQPTAVRTGVAHPLDSESVPPAPDDNAGWRRYLESGGPEPCIPGGVDGAAYRLDRLRTIGNAVVPAQAAVAFQRLLERACGCY